MSFKSVPNIGKELEAKLISVGIANLEQLKQNGSKGAIILLINKYPDTCINVLYAMEGAIHGIRWHGLSIEKRKDLMDFYQKHVV